MHHPFLASSVIRQANSDHDAVMLDTKGRDQGVARRTRGFSSSMRLVGLRIWRQRK